MIRRIQFIGLAFIAASLVACSGASSTSKGGSGDGAGGDGAGGGGGAAAGATTSARFFLPTGEPTNTAAPTLRLDASDGIHTVYPQFVRGGAFYSYCPASCKGPEDVKVVPFATDGTVHNAMLALDAKGNPRVLLSTAQDVYYATCDASCTDAKSWTTTKIVQHGGEREVTGKAFALDLEGRPRFVMHTYKAYLGIGQKKPETFWVSCDSDCAKPDAWNVSKISDQMWRGSSLLFDAKGRAHLATVANVDRTEYSSGKEMGAYVMCEASCGQEASWNGSALGLAFESSLDAVSIEPAISLALTKAGTPRILMLGQFEDTLKRNLTYFACDEGCTDKGWRGSVISDHEKLGAGLELALDAKDHPRFVHTLDYNIALAYCDDDKCDSETAKWDLTKVEYGGDLKPDEIFLYTNCTVGAWFLHSPSLVLTKDGRPRVGYQARDISGGFKNPTPDKTPDCKAGTDLTWSRMAIMPGVSAKQ